MRRWSKVEHSGRTWPTVLHPGRVAPKAVPASSGSFPADSEAISLVAHSDWSVRAEIARVLCERGFRKSLPALLRRLEVEDDAFVRQVILRAIGRLET